MEATPFPKAEDLYPLDHVGVLASGTGTTFQALVDARARGDLPVDVRVLISDQPTAGAIARAEKAGIPSVVVDPKEYPSTYDADRTLAKTLLDHQVGLVFCLGYMRLLGRQTVRTYQNRMINTHPGPLPQFGGKGMYGSHVHAAVAAAGLPESAVTIHMVSNEYDRGPTFMEVRVPLAPGDDAQAIENKVRTAEREAVVTALRAVVTGERSLPKTFA